MSKSHSDIVRNLAPSGAQNVAIKGEFVFIKNASGRLRVVINNEPVVMEAGDLRRVDQPFDAFEIINLSDIEQRVEIVAGYGEYNRLVVRGDISSFPSVIGADGLARPDTRSTISVDLGFIDSTQYSEVFGTLKAQLITINETLNQNFTQGMAFNKDGDLLVPDRNRVKKFDGRTGAFIKETEATELPASFTIRYYHHPEYGLLSIKSGFNEFYTTNIDGIPQDHVLDLRLGRNLSRGYQCLFLPDGKSFFIRSNAVYLVDKNGQVLIDGQDIEQYLDFANSQDGQFLDGGLYFVDPNSSEHIFFATGSVLTGADIYRIKVRTGEYYLVEEKANFSSGGASPPNFFTAPRWNYETERFEYGWTTQSVMATETADFWGKVASKRTDNSGVFMTAESSPVTKNTEIAGQQFDEVNKYWLVDWVRVALEKYYKANGAKEVPSNYLDYVHGLKINGEKLGAESYESFKRQNITDFFGARMPARVELTVTNELKYL